MQCAIVILRGFTLQGLDLGKKKKKKKVDIGLDDLKKLMIADDTTEQNEPVDSVGGAVPDQLVEKKQEDYDKGILN